MANGSSHVVRRTGLTPLVDKLAAAQGKFGAHISIAKRKDFSFFVNALGSNELKNTVLVLRNSQIGDRPRGRIELREITSASLSVEYRYYLHRRLLGLRNIEVARTRVSDNTDVLREVDRIHLSKCSGTRDRLQYRHRHSHLHIALDSTGCMLLDEH